MRHVLLSLLVVGAVVYAAHLLFSASDVKPFDEKKPASANVGLSQALPRSGQNVPPKIDIDQAREHAEPTGAVEAMGPVALDSPHAISVDQPPLPAQGSETSPNMREGASALPLASTEAPAVAETNQTKFMRVTSPASIREGPSATTSIIGIAQPGAEAQVVSRASDWVEIIDPGSKKTGWIHESFLAPEAEPVSRPVPPEEVDAALAAPAEGDTASVDEKPSLASKSHNQVGRHRHYRHGFALGFFRRFW